MQKKYQSLGPATVKRRSCRSLNEKLTHVPVLAYPKFGADAGVFTFETDASAIGIGAVLE